MTLGIQKGDKVAIVLENCVEIYESYWAITKIGGVFVPLSTLLQPKALQTLIHNSDSNTVIASTKFKTVFSSIKSLLPKVKYYIFVDENNNSPSSIHQEKEFLDYHELKEKGLESEPELKEAIKESDMINIMYSSGTTGQPKGIIHTHFVRALYSLLYAASFKVSKHVVAIHAGGMVFNGAFVALLPTLFQGGTFVLLKNYQPELWIEAVKRERATHAVLVPSQIVSLLNCPQFSFENLSSLEALITLGAPLLKNHKDRITTTLPGIFYELYGTTEGLVTILTNDEFPKKPDSVGRPPAFCVIKILNERGVELSPKGIGEICGTSPLAMPGYYKDSINTNDVIRNGLMHTGDLGYLDEDGYLYLVDRKKDMIISGGVKVYPRDIEEMIVKHPLICDAAVFGVPHPKWGEVPVAAVRILPSNATTTTTTELKNWINENVDAKFQRIHEIFILEEFPTNVAGKTLKREIKETYLTKGSPEQALPLNSKL